MKIKITFKDPDRVYEAIQEAAESEAKSIQGLDTHEMALISDTKFKKLSEQCKPWIEYGEYVTIEIDTDAGTATVLKVKP